jgi:hypothetical protein
MTRRGANNPSLPVIPGLRQAAHPRYAIAHRGMTAVDVFPALATAVIASAAKQSSFVADVPWIASLRSQ